MQKTVGAVELLAFSYRFKVSRTGAPPNEVLGPSCIQFEFFGVSVIDLQAVT